MLFYIISAILIFLLFLPDFKYISTLGFSFADDSLGPFVFLVSAYVIMLNWKKIKEAEIMPQPLGLIGIVLSILLYFAGLRAELPQVYHVSFIFFLLTSIFYIFGRTITGLLLFPIAYTFFVIPISFIKETIGVPLRFFVSAASTSFFNILGMNAHRMGTSIYTDNFSFDIAAPCSGINSLFSLLALAAIFAYLTEHSNIKRLILFISAIPIAVISNIIRVSSIGLVAKGFNKDIALSIYHDYSGYVIFLISLALLFLQKKLLDLLPLKIRGNEGVTNNCHLEQSEGLPNKMKTTHKIIYLSILVIATILLYFTPLTQSTEVNNFDLSVFSTKTTFGNWHLAEDIGPTEAEIKGLPGSSILRKFYKNETGDEVQMVIVANNFRSSIHSPTDCLPAQGWVIDSMKVIKQLAAGDTVRINHIESHISSNKGTARSTVWYWYATCGENYSGHFSAVLHNAIQRVLFGRKHNWALVRLSTSSAEQKDKQANAILQNFLKQAYPTIKQSKDSI